MRSPTIGSTGCGRDRAAGKLTVARTLPLPRRLPAASSDDHSRKHRLRSLGAVRIVQNEIAGRNRVGPTSGHGGGRRRSRPLPADPIAGRVQSSGARRGTREPSNGSRPRAVGPRADGRQSVNAAASVPRTPPPIRHWRSRQRDAHMIGAVLRTTPGGGHIVSTGAGGRVDGASRPRPSAAIRSVARMSNELALKRTGTRSRTPRTLRTSEVVVPCCRYPCDLVR